MIPEQGFIVVQGARVHNLKNIDVKIPKNKLVVITGISGSGKSSLAFDTIFAEGQRRYMESFAAYARQFVGDLDRPDVDKISGLSPVISIEQKTTNRNPRSTVGTVTEVYDFMRLLYARVADAYSYNTGKKMTKFSEEEIVAHIQEHFAGKKIMLLAPIIRGRKGHYRELFEQLRKQGYVKVRIDGEVTDLKEKMQLDRYKIHEIELVVDRIVVQADGHSRMSQSIQKCLQLGKDLMFVADVETDKIHQYSKQLMCVETGISYEEPSPNTFSFNSPYGACPKCKGLGKVYAVNMQSVLPDTTKSINEGAIAPLGVERDSWSYQMATTLAKKNKIPLDKPIKDIPEKQLNLLLYGNEQGVITYVSDDTVSYTEQVVKHNYEGIVNMVLRWFSETTSEGVRSWAESFMELNTCPECNGARLKKESLFFKVDEKNIAELADLSLLALMEWFEGIEKRLSVKQKTIAKDILKEIRDRLHFLLDVGLHYLTMDRPHPHPEWR
jgi:excinuclease ABC subunit A